MKLILRYNLYLALITAALTMIFYYYNNHQAVVISGGCTIFLLISAVLHARNYLSKKHSITMSFYSKCKQHLADTGDLIVDKEGIEVYKEIIDHIRNATTFINELSANNFDVKFKGIDEKLNYRNQDNLAGELLRMRDRFKEVAEQQKKSQAEENKRTWAAQGLAIFADLIRNNSNDVNELSNAIVTNLVKYTESNQAGLFMLKEDDDNNKYFELLAAYAYERQKYCDMQVNWGDGLIGACALEKDFIYLTDVPKDYIRITSGLGLSSPRALLLVPLILHEEIYGVIEMASFEAYEPYKIEFVKKIGEIVAANIANIRITHKTNQLLEQTRKQAEDLQIHQEEMRIRAEEMTAQEEELRQNLEELMAIQEDAALKEAEMKGILDGIDHSIMKAEFNPHGKIINVNDKLLSVFGYNLNDLLELGLGLFQHEIEYERFQEIWNRIVSGKHHEGLYKCLSKSGKDIWLIATFAPILDQYGNIVRVLVLANNITEQKQKEKIILEQTQKLKDQEEVLQLNMEELQATTEQYDMMTNDLIDKLKFLELVFDGIEIPISVLNETKNNITYLNKQAEQILGIKKSDLNGSTNTDVLEKLELNKLETKTITDKKGRFIAEVVLLKNPTLV